MPIGTPITAPAASVGRYILGLYRQLLRLPASTEAQYWASTNAQRQVQLGDVLGITTGILFNLVAASHALKPVAMVYYSLVVLYSLPVDMATAEAPELHAQALPVDTAATSQGDRGDNNSSVHQAQ